MTRQRAIFLDRDGVLNANLVRRNRPYPPTSLAEVAILPGVPEALAELKAAGFLLIGATNQPDVARGTLQQGIVEAIHEYMLVQLPLTDIRVCYEAVDHCPRRKPNPGMLLEAAQQHDIDLAASFMVGDRWKDIEVGRRAGTRTVFIDHGYAERQPDPPADHAAGSLRDAVPWILTQHIPC